MLENAWSQFHIFLWCLAGGGLIGLAYDFFRVLRKNHRFSFLGIVFQDILFWIFVSVLFLGVTIQLNSGEIRFYLFLGAAAGTVLYYLIFSKLMMKIIELIIKVILAPFVLIYKIFRKPFILVVNIGKKTGKAINIRLREIHKIKKKI